MKQGEISVKTASATTDAKAYGILIDMAYQQMLDAANPTDRRIAADQFTALIRARNAERTPREIRELERQKGLL